MKYGVLIVVLGSWSLGAMQDSEVIKMDNYKQEDGTTFNLDLGLDEIEFDDSGCKNSQLDVKDLLSILPIFKGKTSAEIQERMEQIKTTLPNEYDKIIRSISDGKREKGTTIGINRKRFDIDDKDIITDINAKIQYGLLEVAYENQKIATKNREEDLAQAGRDRMCSRIFSIVGIVFSVPAITLGIINIIKLLH